MAETSQISLGIVLWISSANCLSPELQQPQDLSGAKPEELREGGTEQMLTCRENMRHRSLGG